MFFQDACAQLNIQTLAGGIKYIEQQTHQPLIALN